MTNVQQDRVRGRAVPSRNRHTFADSGITVELHKIGPTTIQRIAEAVRKEAKAYPVGHEWRYPDPPAQEVDIAGEKRVEINPNDPDYRAALDRWGEWAMGQVNERLLRVAAVDAVIPIEHSDAEIKIAADRMRRRLAAEGAEIPVYDAYTPEENDQIIWVSHICIRSLDDFKEFYAALTQRSQVTEEAIQAETATFQPPAMA